MATVRPRPHDLVVGFLLTWALTAQDPAVVVPRDDARLEQIIVERCAAALAKGELVRAERLAGQLGGAGKLAAASTPLRQQRLDGPELHDLVAASVRIVGHYYRCKECEHWHFSGASGFCVDADGHVASCAHVVAPDATMAEAYLVVADLAGNVWPARAVVASDVAADVCVLATGAKGTVPLPLRDRVRVGERCWCLSNPDHQFGFFSEGVVARCYLAPPEPAIPAPPATGAAAGTAGVGPAAQSTLAPLPWLHVTCDFAKGSSGGPIVDAMGNLIGVAQSTTTVVYDEAAELVDTQMVFKTASPAKALQALLPPAAAAAPAQR